MLKPVKKQKYHNGYNEVDVKTIELHTALPYSLYIHKDIKYTLVVEHGTIIDTKTYEYLQKQDVLYIPREDKKQQLSACDDLEKYIMYNKDNAEYCIKLLYEINNKIFSKFLLSDDNKIDVHCVNASVKSIILLMKNDKKFIKKNMSYLKSDPLLEHHSLHVASYAISLGVALNLGYHDLVNLGIAGYLHDLGIKILNQKIIQKNESLTLDELEEVHMHPQHSVELVEHNHIHNPYIIDAIRHHHENLNGSGYPDGIKENNINTFASILTICDVFDALTSDRAYREHMSSFEALSHMMRDDAMQHKFNHQYIQVFIKLLVK